LVRGWLRTAEPHTDVARTPRGPSIPEPSGS
jgi:hypothetical protein